MVMSFFLRSAKKPLPDCYSREAVMRLKSVKLTHFRGYRATTVIPIDEAMTGLLALPEAG